MAVEAECRFTVSEPGRATRDAMGFYHSNGYWKSPLLKRIGMVASMMTEDVDAGMMALGEGRKIAVRCVFVCERTNVCLTNMVHLLFIFIIDADGPTFDQF